MKKIKLSMRWTLILWALVLIWGTHLLLAPSFYLLSEKIFISHAMDIMDNISDLTLEQSHNHLNKAQSAAHLAKLLLSSNVLNNDIQSSASMERYFFEQLTIYPHLAGIYFGMPNGNFFYVSHNEEKVEDGFRTKIIRDTADGRKTELIWRDADFNETSREQDLDAEYDPRTRPWYKKALQAKKICWTSPYIFFTSRRAGVTIAGPSYDSDESLKGIVGVDIDIEELSTFIGRLRVGKTGRAFMLNSNGDVIAYGGLQDFIVRDKERSKLRLPKVDEINNPVIIDAFAALQLPHDGSREIQIREPIFTSFETGGEAYVARFTSFSDEKLPWVIGMYFPEEDYLGSIRDNRRYNLIATIFLSLLATLFVFRFAGIIIRPIVNLAREARAIEKNDLKISFDADSIFREIQAAADSFSKMKGAIIRYRSDLIEKERMYSSITSTVSDAIILVNEYHGVVYWNPAAENLFGCSMAAVVGKDIHEVTGISWNESDLPFFKSQQEGGSGHSTRGRLLVEVVTRHAGCKVLEISLAGLEIDRHPHVVAVLRDAGDRIKAEEIKKQLVRDLHDGVGGNLANMKILAQMEISETSSSSTGSTLASIAEICEGSMLEIRSYMDSLEEKQVSWDHLAADLRQYCAGAVEVHGISFSMRVDIHNACCQPTPLLSLNLHRIIKEGVTNIIKHSEATEVDLIIHIDDDELVCRLQDNGVGLRGSTDRGRGMLNMKSRTVKLGGRFSVEDHQGVVVSINIPLVDDFADRYMGKTENGSGSKECM